MSNPMNPPTSDVLLRAEEAVEDGNVDALATTEIDGSDPLHTTIRTTTTTTGTLDHHESIDEQDSQDLKAVNKPGQESQGHAQEHNRRSWMKRAIDKVANRNPITSTSTTTTIQFQPPAEGESQGQVTLDSLESTTVLTYHPSEKNQSKIAGTAEESAAVGPATTTTEQNKKDEATSGQQQYPETINAKFVKEQSDQNNIQGLQHALSASIDKSSAAKEHGKLFEGGILTSANHKKWYHATLPINWVQKVSSEHHFGNYVITNRKTGTKTWEDMPIYARIGMHLLFAGMFDNKLLQTHKIHHLFSVESVNQGKHFDAPESVAQIDHFIKTYKLELSELLLPDLKDYKSFNEFFYRKLRPDARPIHEPADPNIIVSSADCRLCVFESITAATTMWIKGKHFSVETLIQDKELAAQYEGGSIALFRLAPQDYHRFHSPASGTIARDPAKLPGTYYTVNPMAINEGVDVFTENIRQITVMNLDQTGEAVNSQFDQCVFVSIGALLVGSIHLTGAAAAGNKVVKGDELGYFAYGGSTCILLFKAGAVQFDEDLVANSQKGIETLVQMGERIGQRK
ncbi:hypothetical protein BGZ99_006283 [Dissophora globulifera]|uniref:phosphatidylserine decarboxylase n=1 Tax=Dissophora globulifera TaxID=979702 RepID=A0A9P6US82_9FUNG|nr:hypothetical protein BGZ99_006283 [Dissophora globulifera]